MSLVEGLSILKQGAEAKVFVGHFLGKPAIFKERFQKSYRNPILDANLTKDRMRAEARALLRCRTLGIAVPAVFSVDFPNRCLVLEHIENSQTARTYIEEVRKTNGDNLPPSLRKVMQTIGQQLAKMHQSNVIHGDLTTSNILLRSSSNGQETVGDELEVFLIDFGLSRVDSSVEDKGVDLYVLERAYLSTHHNSEELFQILLKSYQKAYGKGGVEVMKKLDEVRLRGRKRSMVG